MAKEQLLPGFQMHLLIKDKIILFEWFHELVSIKRTRSVRRGRGEKGENSESGQSCQKRTGGSRNRGVDMKNDDAPRTAKVLQLKLFREREGKRTSSSFSSFSWQ